MIRYFLAPIYVHCTYMDVYGTTFFFFATTATTTTIIIIIDQSIWYNIFRLILLAKKWGNTTSVYVCVCLVSIKKISSLLIPYWCWTTENLKFLMTKQILSIFDFENFFPRSIQLPTISYWLNQHKTKKNSFCTKEGGKIKFQWWWKKLSHY